ncbi:MAG: DUF6587 family protein [Rhizobacter sp.]
MQDLLVGLIVAACAVYAAWVLMPASWRRRAAARLAGGPLPSALRARFQRLAKSAPGCGCDGCDAGTPPGVPKKGAPVAGGEQPIQFVRKLPR